MITNEVQILTVHKKTIEVREMSMGTLIQTITQGLIRNDKKDIEIRLVDCYMGAVESYKGLESLLTHDFSMDWKVNVYQLAMMHDNVNNCDYLKIIMADDIEMMD